MTFADNPALFTSLVAGLILFSGFFQGALGFGYAIIALTTLPFILVPQAAHVVVSLSGIPVMAMAAWTTREGADWPLTGRAILGGVIAMPIGLLLFSQMSAAVLIRGTGVAILVLMTLELVRRPNSDTTETKPTSAFLAGLVSGFLAGAVSIGGPPIVAYALKQHWSPLKTKAFITRCLLVIASAKGIALTAGNFVTQTIALQATVAAVVAVTGVYIGAWASRRLEAASYRKLVAVILIAISCWWLWKGDGKSTAIETTTPTSAPEQRHGRPSDGTAVPDVGTSDARDSDRAGAAASR